MTRETPPTIAGRAKGSAVRVAAASRGGRAKEVRHVPHSRHVPRADGAVRGRRRRRVGAPRGARGEQLGAGGEDVGGRR